MEIKKTGAGDVPVYINMMITGNPKTGKTLMLGTVPNILIADTEPFANNLQSVAHLGIPYVTIASLEDLKDLLMVLRDPEMRKRAAESVGIDDIEAVAIDTLDTMQLLMKRQRIEENPSKQFLRDDWAWIKEEMYKIVQAFTSLPMHTIFTVHMKSKDIGSDAHPKTVMLPALDGAISESIAGMVGYSFLAFRRQEITKTGEPVTRYLLQTEGDETHDFLGNRAAGKLPMFIEPDFSTILETITGVALPKREVKKINRTATTKESAPLDTDPVNSAALMHVRKVYEKIREPMPDALNQITMGDARTLVRFWMACDADEKDGNGDSVEEMQTYLAGQGWLAPALPAVSEQTQNHTPETIQEILDRVGDDAEKAKEALATEEGKSTPRKRLVAALSRIIQEPSSPEEVVAESSAIANAESALGASVVMVEDGEVEAVCDECGGPVVDTDIASISKSRFGRWMCVPDYVRETTKKK
jgi:hypothetical protein